MDVVRTISIIIDFSPPPTETEIIQADVNFDNSINVLDIVVMVDAILNEYALCTTTTINCDNNPLSCCYPVTTHKFYWEFDTLGIIDGFLNGVSIVDENNIWVVGQLTFPDSINWSGIKVYNAGHWNGNEWEYFQIPIELVNDDGEVYGYPVNGNLYKVLAFSNDDVWFVLSNGLNTHLYNGEFYHYTFFNGYDASNYSGVGSIWGTSNSNIYTGSRDYGEEMGEIFHFDGENIEIMEKPHTSGVYKIWGINNGKMWAKTSNTSLTQFLEYDGEEWNFKYLNNDVIGRIWSGSTFGDTLYLITENGFWKESISSGEGSIEENESVTQSSYFISQHFESNHYNDLFNLHRELKFAHFNGENWSYDSSVYDSLGGFYGATVYGMDYHQDVIVAVGVYPNSYKGFVARGYPVYD